jgi:hypothetical protein
MNVVLTLLFTRVPLVGTSRGTYVDYLPVLDWWSVEWVHALSVFGFRSLRPDGTASGCNDGGTKRRGFRLKTVITHRRATHHM